MNGGKHRLLPVLATGALLLAGSAAWAREDGGDNGPIKLLTTIPVPPVAGNATGGLYAFDISFIDPHTQLYYLADRSNAVIDVVDARTNAFVKQIKGGFKGFTGSNDTSGPDGVVAAGRFLFVTDAPSRVVTIDLTTDKVVSEVSTGGAPGLRADEFAYDPEDGLLLVVNNADDPPFATLITVNKTTGALTVGKRVTFTDATNGDYRRAHRRQARDVHGCDQRRRAADMGSAHPPVLHLDPRSRRPRRHRAERRRGPDHREWDDR